MTQEARKVATLAEIRTRVRSRLEEATAAAWLDSEIDEAITESLDRYNLSFQLEKTTTAAVAAGDVLTAVPAGCVGVVRVVRGDGCVVPRRGQPEGWTSDELMTWEQYAGSIRFSGTLDDETLTIWYRGSHLVTEVPDGDVLLLVLGGVARALEQRAVQDAKRGNDAGDARSAARDARAEFSEALRARSRRMRVGAVQRS